MRNRESTGFARTLGLYFTIAFAALQVLDVLLDRLALPERLFTQASVAVVLLLPAAVAVGLIRRLLAEEDLPLAARSLNLTERARVESRERERWAGPEPDLAETHLRIARLYEERGDTDRALHHYEMYVSIAASADTGGRERASD